MKMHGFNVKVSIELFIGMILVFQGLFYVLKSVYIGGQLYSNVLELLNT
jgi:hypothetical protein